MDKFSILMQELDIYRLKKRIFEFKKKNGCDPFIVCNMSTALYMRTANSVVASMSVEEMEDFSVREVINHTLKYDFGDYKILIDENKKLGDIELR